MFGRKSSQSANEKFVMAMGQKAGNIKKITPAKAGAGKQTVRKAPSAPLKKEMSAKGPGKKLRPQENLKRGVQVDQNRPMSLGKANTFKTSGILSK